MAPSEVTPATVASGRLQGSTWCTQWQMLMWKHGLSAKRQWKGTLGQLLTPILVVLMLIGLQKASDVVLNKHGTLKLSCRADQCGIRARTETWLACADEFPITMPIDPLARCTHSKHQKSVAFVSMDGAIAKSPCITLLYAPDTTAVRRLLRFIAEDSGLDTGLDFAPLPGAVQGDLNPAHRGNVSLSNSTHCVPGACDFAPDASCLPCSFIFDNATLSDYILANPNVTQLAVQFLTPYLLGRQHSTHVNSTAGYLIYRNA